MEHATPSPGSTAAVPPRFPARYVRRAEARRRHGALADVLGEHMLRGDPLADAVVAWLSAAGPEGREFVRRALEGPLDAPAPAPLQTLLDDALARPPWLDDARLALGARTYQRIGKPLLFILSAWSLMNGYHSGPAVKPLTFTGQLDRMAPRRLAETGRFLVEVCQDGGVAPYAEGWRIALRVRLMHAGVRRMILRSGEWDSARWGLPINQADMAGTIIEFSLLVLAGARELGFRFRPAESEALVHLWRWVGHLSGVAAPLLDELAHEARGVAFAELVKLVQPGPDQDSLDLAAALRVVPREAARTRREKLLAAAVVPYHDGLTWAFNGDAIARALRIPNRAWRHAIHPTRLLVGGLETIRQTLPGGDALFARAGNRALHADIARMLEGAEPDFVPRRV